MLDLPDGVKLNFLFMMTLTFLGEFVGGILEDQELMVLLFCNGKFSKKKYQDLWKEGRIKNRALWNALLKVKVGFA